MSKGWVRLWYPDEGERGLWGDGPYEMDRSPGLVMLANETETTVFAHVDRLALPSAIGLVLEAAELRETKMSEGPERMLDRLLGDMVDQGYELWHLPSEEDDRRYRFRIIGFDVVGFGPSPESAVRDVMEQWRFTISAPLTPTRGTV